MKNRWIALAFLVVITTPLQTSAQHQHEWSYEGDEGPQHWGDLKGQYSICKTGKEQSPIDIRDVTTAQLPAIRFEYKDAPLKIINNGHTIQVNYAPGSFIVVGDK